MRITQLTRYSFDVFRLSSPANLADDNDFIVSRVRAYVRAFAREPAARFAPFRQICETIVNRSTPLGIRESGQAASPHSTESPGRHRVFKSPLSPQESETMFRNASYQSCLKS